MASWERARGNSGTAWCFQGLHRFIELQMHLTYRMCPISDFKVVIGHFCLVNEFVVTRSRRPARIY